MRPIAILLALALAVLGFAQTQTTQAKLRAGDEILVVVNGFDKFSGDYIVSDDGMLTGVGFGSVQAAGKTIEELRKAITAGLKKRLKEPVVELVLKKQTVRVIYVVGGKEGVPIPYSLTLDLRQIVGMAGLTDTPEMVDCVVSRKGEPVRRINLPKLLRGAESEWNGPMQPDDVVTFLNKIFRVSVSGEVTMPGEYPVAESGLISAIAQAQGATKEGTLKNVLIFRGPDVFQVDVSAAQTGKPVSFSLKPGDSIVVRKSENAVYVLGEVRMPGRYIVPDEKEYHASDLLAAAQGLTEKGSLRRMALVRPDKDGKFIAKQFNLDEFVKDGKLASNPKLQSGDILMFSESKAAPFASLNQIASTAFLFSGILKP
jgi:protein involved in polysaccharide export with SLBB domain